MFRLHFSHLQALPDVCRHDISKAINERHRNCLMHFHLTLKSVFKPMLKEYLLAHSLCSVEEEMCIFIKISFLTKLFGFVILTCFIFVI
jgi:hypothetical protein